jgi:hypothetical protein
MAEKQNKPSKPEDKPRKKAAETVQLTAEDLRKISGGAALPKLGTQPSDVPKGPIKKG